MKKISEQWLKAAEDDLRVIMRIVDDEYLTHMVAFHSQQCIEKSLKAIIEEYEIGHFRIHNLGRLLEIVKGHIIFEAEIDLIEKLEKLYIDARYPADLGLLPDGKPTMDDAKRFQQLAKTIYNGARSLLENR